MIKLFSFKNQNIVLSATNYVRKFNKTVVTMHARIGDYLTDFDKFFDRHDDGNYYQKRDNIWPTMDYDYFIRAIELTLNILEQSLNQCIFIIVAENGKKNGYISKLVNKIRAHFNNIDLRIYNYSLIADFTVLREADVCITSASSYSWWAAWLNTRCKAIISPKYWFQYYKYTKKSQDAVSSPLDIEMSLPNQYFIYSKGFLNNMD